MNTAPAKAQYFLTDYASMQEGFENFLLLSVLLLVEEIQNSVP